MKPSLSLSAVSKTITTIFLVASAVIFLRLLFVMPLLMIAFAAVCIGLYLFFLSKERR